MAAKRGKRISCDDCFFRQNMLCALDLSEPCTTFRPADRGLVPPRQLSFHFRPDRTRLLYTFPPPEQQLAHADA
jgi:hypothetical protein